MSERYVTSRAEAIQMDAEELQHYSDVLVSDLAQARADMAGAVGEIRRYREYLQARQPRERAPWEGASELVAPYAKQSIFALLAEVAPALLNVDPLARVSHIGGRDLADHGPLWESFYEALFRQKTRWRQTMTALYHRSFIDSAAVLQTTWEVREGWRHGWNTRLVNQIDAGGQARLAVASIEPMRAVTTVYDLPRYDIIPIEQFTVFPAANADIQESAGVAARFEVSAHTLMDGARMGMFGREQVRQVLEFCAQAVTFTSPDDQQHGVGTGNPETDTGRLTIPITECYWRMPGGVQRSTFTVQGDGAAENWGPGEDWLITLHEPSGMILRALPTPWWHGKRPFAVCRPYPDCAGILGDSVLSAGAAHVQDAKTTLLRLAIDAMALGVNPRLLVAASLYNKAREALQKGNKPGGLIPLPDQVFQNRAQSLQPLVSGYTPDSVLPLLQMIDSEGQRATGITDALKGIAATNNVTATQAQQILESSKKLVGLIVENCADTTSEVLQQTHGLVVQFMGRESVRRLWDEVNGEHGVPIEVAAAANYFVEANGISETSNQAIRAMRASEMASFLSSEPNVMGNPVRRYNLRRYVLQQQGIRNPEDIMGTAEEWAREDGLQNANLPW